MIPARKSSRRVAAAACAGAALALLGTAGGASAALSGKTDVLFVFDTTGSMSGALDAAKESVGTITGELSARLGDVQFGVADMRDYANVGSYGDSGDVTWQVRRPMTGSTAEVKAGLDALEAGGGGDAPEAYGRALSEALRGDGIGWRTGARHVIVLIADNVPHDDDLQSGVPQSIIDEGAQATPWDTGVDPGRNENIGDADDVDWQPLLASMKAAGRPLGMVLFQGGSAYLPYWQHWAGITGGMATDADANTVVSKMIDIATETAKKVDATPASAVTPAPVALALVKLGPSLQLRYPKKKKGRPYVEVPCTVGSAATLAECTATITAGGGPAKKGSAEGRTESAKVSGVIGKATGKAAKGGSITVRVPISSKTARKALAKRSLSVQIALQAKATDGRSASDTSATKILKARKK